MHSPLFVGTWARRVGGLVADGKQKKVQPSTNKTKPGIPGVPECQSAWSRLSSYENEALAWRASRKALRFSLVGICRGDPYDGVLLLGIDGP